MRGWRPDAEVETGGAEHGADPDIAGVQHVEMPLGGEERVGRSEGRGPQRNGVSGQVAGKCCGYRLNQRCKLCLRQLDKGNAGDAFDIAAPNSISCSQNASLREQG